MNNALDDLARAAEPRQSTPHVPDYPRIRSCARELRVVAALCSIVGAAAWLGGVGACLVYADGAAQELRRVERHAEWAAGPGEAARLDSVRREASSLGTEVLVGRAGVVVAFGVGLLFFLGAAIARAAAWSALAHRDAARNTFFIRAAMTRT